MNRRVIAAVTAAVVLAGASFGAYRLGQRSAQHAPTAAPEAGRKILYWQDPMAPGKRFDKPGKSPYMDMDLVPVYADQEPAEGTVRVSPDVQQNLGIRLAEVRQGQLGGALRLVGNIAFNERERVLVQARSNGFVERLYVRAPLEPVRRGQALLDLYVPDWVAAQEEYLSIRRMGAAQSAGLLDAAQQRMRLAGMTDEQIRQVAARGQVIKRVTVTAPAAGVVSELAAREGMTVSAGTPMMTISGLASVWVNAEVPENAVAQVRPGTAVEATTPAYPGEHFNGKVESLLPQVDPTTRTLVARIVLSNPGGKLSPGMFATIGVAGAGRRQALVVPSEAVIQTGTRTVVIVAQGDGKFMPVEVSIGAEANGETEIQSGLSAGQRVVASGQFLIDSEASLRGAVRRLEGAAQTRQPVAAPAVHHGMGKIEKIGPDEVTISHGPIQTLGWGAMTMGFVPPAAGMPPEVKAGDSVSFDIQAHPDGRYQIVAMARQRMAAPKANHTPAQPGAGHGAHPAMDQPDATHGDHGAHGVVEDMPHEHGAHQ